jgi:hypothetical protein
MMQTACHVTASVLNHPVGSALSGRYAGVVTFEVNAANLIWQWSFYELHGVKVSVQASRRQGRATLNLAQSPVIVLP